MTAAQRGPHKSALELEVKEMMHADIKDKIKEAFAELVYLDEIDDCRKVNEYHVAHIYHRPKIL